MPSKIHYNVKFTESQLLSYLKQYRVFSPKKFDSTKDLVEITIAIFAKRHFEKTSKRKLLIAFETKEKINITSMELNDPHMVNKILKERDHNSLIDFMLVPIDKTNIAYAFQIKRVFIKTTDENIEELIVKEINKSLKLKLSQKINLIISPDKYQKSFIWPTKINLRKLRKLVNKRDSSYDEVFIMSDKRLIRL